jgi:hypothetical protein
MFAAVTTASRVIDTGDQSQTIGPACAVWKDVRLPTMCLFILKTEP